MTEKILFLLLFTLALGCSGSDNDTNEAQVKDSVFDAQIKAIDKARALEKQILEAAEKQRKIIDDQGG